MTRARWLLPLIYLGFVSLGLPDGAFGVAWPAIYPELHLPLGLAGTVLTLGTVFAGISGFSSGWLLARFSCGPVVLVSGILTASGLFILGHAQGAAWLYATAVPLGFGAGAVDASLNGFVARHYSGRHMNWLHACWGIGAACGPLVIGRAIQTDHGWRGGYLFLASVQAGLAVIFACTLAWWKTVPASKAAPGENADGHRSRGLAANSFAGWLSPLIFALYVAAEMTTGLWAGTILMAGRGFSPGAAAACTSAFYAAITGGRILVGLVIDRWGNRVLINAGLVVSLLGSVWFALDAGTPATASAALIVLGFGLAPIYPGLMHEVPRRFAPDAVQTIIGRQSGAAGFGAAVVPALAGWVAQTSLEVVPYLVLASVVVLAGSIRHLNRLA